MHGFLFLTVYLFCRVFFSDPFLFNFQMDVDVAEAILSVVVQGVLSVSKYERLFCRCFCAAVRPFHGPDGAARAFKRGLRL